MKATALVGRVTDVQPHPDNDVLRTRMDIVTISGKTNVATRPEPNEPRYKVGDYAVMLVENTILPDWLIKHLGMWDTAKTKGGLSGKLGNRLRPRSLGVTNKIVSEVALCPCWWTRNPTRTANDIIAQEGILRFTPEFLDDWAKDDGERTPCTMITKYTHNGVETISRSRFYLPIGQPDLQIDDGVTPEGEDVAWNFGIEEIHEVKE
jgi:hypothetical protein